MNEDTAPQASAIDARANEVIAAIKGFRFRHGTERQLQDGLEEVFQLSNFAYKRECILSKRDRPDFLLEPGLVVEVKIDGSLADLLRQCARYAEHDQVQAIIAVGTKYWLPSLPGEVGGKPLYHLRLIGSLL
jgi:hypothetical protein